MAERGATLMSLLGGDSDDLGAYRIRGPACVSFSGGRTSGYMLARILEAHGGLLPIDVHVLFANTGRERPETLEFVRECGEHWGVDIVWLEYAGDGGRRAYREVDYASASRNGEPFEALINHRGAVPNLTSRWCTSELKVNRIRAWMRARGYEHWTDVVGLRADEPRRVTKRRAASDDEVDYALPLADAGVTVDDVRAYWRAQPFDLRVHEGGGNCDACLAGETEVVTSDGIKPIRELAGKTPWLLVPKVSNGGISEIGSFVQAPVRSFGVQQLWRVELAGHARSRKIVYATEDHRWFVRSKAGAVEAVTRSLRMGDQLKNLNRCPIGQDRGGLSRIAALQGFVFGDGTMASGDRPGTLDIHEGPKLQAMGPMFRVLLGEPAKTVNSRGTNVDHFYGVPRRWKTELPPLDESRHFLMGWLSGWFAADGCVTKDGGCVLNSAKREHLEYARSLCAVLGVQCSQVRGGKRTAVLPNGKPFDGELYAVSINRFHLTDGFFWLEHHRSRVKESSRKEERRYGWTVESVTATDRREEVFCATVEGVGAFGLADGLMTGNCMMKGPGVLIREIRRDPSVAGWWSLMERRTGRRFASAYSYDDLRAVALLPADRLTGRARALAENTDAAMPCACTD